MIKLEWPDGSTLTLDELKEDVRSTTDLGVIKEHLKTALNVSSFFLATERGRTINTELIEALRLLDDYMDYLSNWEPRPSPPGQAMG